MITKWIIAAVIFLAKLIIPPGYWPSNELPRIDPNKPCSACGNRSGRIRTKRLPNNTMVVEHTCNTCGAIDYAQPIVKGRHVTHTHSAAAKSSRDEAPEATPPPATQIVAR